MNRLQLLLQKMRNVDWVNRPSEDGQGDIPIGPQTDIVKPREVQGGKGNPPGGPVPPTPNQPLNPQALDSLTSEAMANSPELAQKPPTSNPYGSKMQHLATMGKIQNMKYPGLKPKKTLAGDDDGLGIY